MSPTDFLTGLVLTVLHTFKWAAMRFMHLAMSVVGLGEVSGHDFHETGVKSGRMPCPYATTLDAHPYIAPTAADSRAPCPALNVMANHGYLPRNGRQISGQDLVHALQAAYNLSAPLAYFLAWGGIVLLGQLGRISLGDLARHNHIEHDASLTHMNTAPSEEYAPCEQDPTLFSDLLSDARDNSYGVEDIARARVRREKEPGTQIDAVHQEVARGEVALVLNIFGDDQYRVPVHIMHTWWHEERFPEGWTPVRETTLLGTISMSTKIRHAMTAIRQKMSLL